MRHKKSGRKFNRTNSHRKAMFRNMVTSLLEHEQITTTVPKAKELRGIVDRMITYGKKGVSATKPEDTLHYKRMAARYIRSRDVLVKLFDEVAPRFADRPGGYTRIYKLGWRKGDAADMALIQLIPEDEKVTARARKRDAAPATSEAAPVTSKESFDDAPAADDE